MKLAPIDFSHRVAKDSRNSWLQTLGNLLIERTLGILTTNVTYWIVLPDESQVNACVV